MQRLQWFYQSSEALPDRATLEQRTKGLRTRGRQPGDPTTPANLPWYLAAAGWRTSRVWRLLLDAGLCRQGGAGADDCWPLESAGGTIVTWSRLPHLRPTIAASA